MHRYQVFDFTGIRQGRGGEARRSHLLLLAASTLVWTWLGQGVNARAAAERPSIAKVRWGLEGRFKLGAWTPITVQLRAGSEPVQGKLQISVADGEEMQASYQSRQADIQLAAGETRDVLRYVRLGRQRAPLQVEFVPTSGAPVVWNSPPDQLPRGTITSKPLIAIIGNDPGLRERRDQSTRLASEEFEICLLDPNKSPLPTERLGYDSIDVLVISTTGPAAQGLTTENLIAIEEWVRLGGKLIWYGATDVDGLIQKNKTWSQLVPGTWEGVAPLPRLAGLEGVFGAKDAIPIGREGIPIARITEPHGITRVNEGIGRRQQPLWIHAPHGFGQITFLGLDIDRPPVSTWPGKTDLLDRFITDSLGPEPTREEQARKGQAAHLGYRDLSGQLRAALDQFGSVQTFPVLLAGGIALLYLALVGPGDYFLLAVWWKRTTWTWLTFPLLVISFCGFTFWLSHHWKGTQSIWNEAHLIDYDASTGLARGTSWLHLFSPRSDRIALDLVPPAAWNAREMSVSWQGLAGDGFAGMDHVAQEAKSDDHYVQITDLASDPTRRFHASVDAYPFRANSSHGFYGTWIGQGSGKGETPVLSADLNGLLHGTLVNTWGVTLEEAWLCHGRWAYRIPGVWTPGTSLDVDSIRNERDLQALLTQRHYVKEQGKDNRDVATAWDQGSYQVHDILRMMLLHQAAGGSEYTNLLNRQASRLDWSDQLHLGRAMVLGTVKDAGITWTFSDSVRDAKRHGSWTYFRALLPVQVATSQPLAPLEQD